MWRGKGLGERSQARDDNWCGDEGRGTAWPQGLPAQAHGKGGGMYFLGWVFEQVEGISKTVNTGELDKTVLSYSSVWAALAYTFRNIKTPTHTNIRWCLDSRKTVVELTVNVLFYFWFLLSVKTVSCFRACPPLLYSDSRISAPGQGNHAKMCAVSFEFIPGLWSSIPHTYNIDRFDLSIVQLNL